MTPPEDNPTPAGQSLVIDAAWKERIEGKLDRLGDKLESSTSGIMAQLDFVAREGSSRLESARTIIVADLRGVEKEGAVGLANLRAETVQMVTGINEKVASIVNERTNDRKEITANKRLAIASIISIIALIISAIGVFAAYVH